ncbi:hypothetical protein PTRA_a2561 [Pseudoalteromonas translucida KMM 520]|uniref:Uncharacterized protein n=1 Tax=Pseudoalteromonas translucida KMM 520 TaxID=1315283 RepID=A0A0U2VJM0_9GAMM|nr:hypothetical protein PTRA_a2561 [Pseudoalteromonas translucida KMM 520]
MQFALQLELTQYCLLLSAITRYFAKLLAILIYWRTPNEV